MIKKTTLHEFCHVLGFRHEHQHSNCPIIWPNDVYIFFQENYGWNKDKVDFNIVKKDFSIELLDYDKDSIMHYDFSDLFKDKNYCGGLILSAKDIVTIKKLYGDKRKILLIGPSNTGKSTIINSLINNSCEKEFLNKPCSTSDSILDCTQKFEDFENYDYILMDTIGFNLKNLEKIYFQFKNLLNNCSTGIDWFILTIKKDRLEEDILCTYDAILKLFTDHNIKENTILLITHNDDNDADNWIIQNLDFFNKIKDKFGLNKVSTTMLTNNVLEIEKALKQQRQKSLNDLKLKLKEPNKTVYLNSHILKELTFNNMLADIITILLCDQSDFLILDGKQYKINLLKTKKELMIDFIDKLSYKIRNKNKSKTI